MSLEDLEDEYLRSCEEHDNWIDRVEATIASISDALPVSANPSYSNLRSVAADVVDGKISFDEAVNRFTSKKIIKKTSLD